MNKFKKLPLMALVLGLGLITIGGMSSFKGEKRTTDVTYGYDRNTGLWVNLSTLPPDKIGACDLTEGVCKAKFDSDIIPNPNSPVVIDPATVPAGQRIDFGVFTVEDL